MQRDNEIGCFEAIFCSILLLFVCFFLSIGFFPVGLFLSFGIIGWIITEGIKLIKSKLRK